MLKSMLQHVNAEVLMDIFSPPIISGHVCSSYGGQSYQLPVLDTMFVRKKHRGKDSGLIMLEDFVDSFAEDSLGLRYPMSSFTYTGKLFILLILFVLSLRVQMSAVIQAPCLWLYPQFLY